MGPFVAVADAMVCRKLHGGNGLLCARVGFGRRSRWGVAALSTCPRRVEGRGSVIARAREGPDPPPGILLILLGELSKIPIEDVRRGSRGDFRNPPEVRRNATRSRLRDPPGQRNLGVRIRRNHPKP